jgi:xanthine dehydrogenase molybdopterin-binding subunit B
MKNAQRQLLAVGKVRFVGEPVAAVVAENKYVARDAADLIEIDYDVLPAVGRSGEGDGSGEPTSIRRILRTTSHTTLVSKLEIPKKLSRTRT